MEKNVIGKKDLFAIEYEITEIYQKVIYGKFCYWIQGRQLGRYEEGTNINNMLWSVPSLVRDNGNREHKNFFYLELNEVFYRLSGKAFFEADMDYEQIANEEMWARFNICIFVDILFDCNIYLIDYKEEARLIYSLPDKSLYQKYLKRGIVDNVLKNFYIEINKIYDKYIEEK